MGKLHKMPGEWSASSLHLTLSLPEQLTKQKDKDGEKACLPAFMPCFSLASSRSSLSLCVSGVRDHSRKKEKNTKRNLSPHFSEQVESPELDPFLKRPVSSCNLSGSQKLEGGPASRVRVVSWAGQGSPGADLPTGGS